MGRFAIIEVRGGSDKNSDGHRNDTIPMIKELINLNYYAVSVYFSDKDYDKLLEYLSDFDAVLPRINPGQYYGFTKSLFIKFLQQLSDNYNVLS